MIKVTFKAGDDYTLHGLWAVPVDGALGTVVVNAATGVKKEFYIRFANFLVHQGYRVLLYDYRGIGASAPESLKGFRASMHEWGTLDMNAALDYVVEEKRAEDVIWIGHSIGAQMVGLLDRRKHIKKMLAISASTGYWGYFPFPYNWMVLSLWTLVGPPMTRFKGYAPMKRLGWGEDLPKDVYFQWRAWCLTREHFTPFLRAHYGIEKFEDFDAPIVAIYPTDDYIANHRTVDALLAFYPASPSKKISISPKEVGVKKIGHTGIFRSRFEKTIWPMIVKEMESD